ncbi:MAG TPA: MoaD/ThiS family protein [Chloroflexi bacterium]|nr:MoaD/ThiS family protein [Chloroflexota bacterium]
MRVYVKLLATYQKYLPPEAEGSTYPLEVEPGTTVEELVATLPIPGRDASVVLVNGRGPQPDQTLREDDVVCLFPAIAGG